MRPTDTITFVVAVIVTGTAWLVSRHQRRPVRERGARRVRRADVHARERVPAGGRPPEDRAQRRRLRVFVARRAGVDGDPVAKRQRLAQILARGGGGPRWREGGRDRRARGGRRGALGFVGRAEPGLDR